MEPFDGSGSIGAVIIPQSQICAHSLSRKTIDLHTHWTTNNNGTEWGVLTVITFVWLAGRGDILMNAYGTVCDDNNGIVLL